MCAGWIKGNFNPGVIVSEINKIRKEKAGKITYSNLGIEPLGLSLFTAVKIDKRISIPDAQGLVRSALDTNYPNGKVEADLFIKKISHLEKSYLRRKLKPYVLRTSISVSGILPFRYLKINDATVRFTLNVRAFDQSPALRSGDLKFFGELPSEYHPVLIDAKGRSVYDAADHAIDSLDLIRAFWNLRLTPPISFRFSSGRKRPFNKVRLGPIHTLHNHDGSMPNPNIYWYEQDFLHPGEIENVGSKREDLRKFTRRYRTLLERSTLRNSTQEGLLRYTRALDRWSLEIAFIELWSVLEFLTNTLEQRYEVTIKRASALFSDYQLALEIARNLMTVRNAAVHTNQPNPFAEQMISQLKTFVVHLLGFYLRNQFGLKSRQEVGEFLDLTPDTKHLPRRIALSKFAIQYRPP